MSGDVMGAGGRCLNCTARLAGEFCHVCGQPGHVHRSLGAIWHDLAHGAFHFEGRIWRTLPMLVARPGELTRRYVAGERARFVSPLALFLFVVFLTFAILSVAGVHLELPGNSAGKRAAELKALIPAKAQITARLAELERQRAVLAGQGKPTGDVDEEIATQGVAQRAVDIGLAAAQSGEGQHVGQSDLHTGWHRLDEGAKMAAENPNLLLYKLQSNAYKYSWVLIPISVPFVWLLFFWRRDLFLFDHTVFVTYSLSFVSLLILVLSLLGAVGVSATLLGIAGSIVVPVHLYRQLRGAYGVGRAGGLVRVALLLAFAFAALMLFAALLLGLGLVG